MSSRNSVASLLMPCLLAVGFLGIASATNDASAGKSIRKSGESGRNYVLERKRRAHGARIRLPIGPSYLYYDYPYYYSRGHYPTHIVRYVYYPSYYRSYDRGSGSPRRQKARRN
jgi:hypothetical protein